MSDYVPTIGLEIHAELKTRTKMFCSSKNDPDEEKTNANVCPVCMAHPGTLPVINKEAVRHVLRVGLALGSDLADYTEFDRKNYFYPDLPKGYQLSQYEYPLVSHGTLAGVAITRIHLEEDTASSIHTEGEGTSIDYNRAGIPLMELVTEPVITSAKQAGNFARELQLLLRYLDASNANMEKGEMRVEANVSVSRDGILGTKVEIKNLNSFRAMERAVEYEIKRHSELLKKGEKVIQETRGWDEGKQSTFAQRVKEGSADYRYFPDPDLPSLRLSEIPELERAVLTDSLPELPWQRRERYLSYGLKTDDADAFVRDDRFGRFFEAAIVGWEGAKEKINMAANYLANDVVSIIRDIEKRDSALSPEISISAHNFKVIVDLAAGKKISSRAAKDLLLECFMHPEAIALQLVEQKNLLMSGASSDALSGIVSQVIATHPTVVADFRGGKEAALQYLVGQAMKASKGSGDPVTLRELILQAIRA